MKLVIVHYHFRPSGVRRIIELATPHLLRALRPGVREIVLAGGEAPDEPWRRLFVRQAGGVPVRFHIEPAFGYFSEQDRPPEVMARRIRQALDTLLGGLGAGNGLVWAHNLGLARNLLLTRELERACEARRIPLLAHHHDWWFDNRWQRWPEMRRAGFRALDAVARAVFSTAPNVRHVAINRADAVILRRHFGQRSEWVPDLTEPVALPAPARVRSARRWLRDQLGDDAPVWLVPARLLRRKNIAEALLLTRWLRPEAWLAITGSVSSEDEQLYGDRLADAVQRHGWRLRLGLLQGDESAKPTVEELIAACEAVMFTSIQEGFGLPSLEAAAARRPLIARRLPNIAPDLARFGFRFPQSYDELLVSPHLFDWRAEVARQVRLFREWLEQLPRPCRQWAGGPVVLATRHAPRPVSLSRLTLTAQLEVLARPSEESWALCAPLNPFLRPWRALAARGALRVTPWPRTAARWLGGPAYARRLARLLEAGSGAKLNPLAARNAQRQFLAERLSASNLYPLLWSTDP